jgi:hypothetical protein
MSKNIRDSYNIRKIKNFNNIDQMYNNEDMKNLIIKPQKINKPNINIKSLVDSKKIDFEKDLSDAFLKRTNQPYKGIIKNFDYNKQIKEREDLIIHKVTTEDKNKDNFEKKMTNFKSIINDQNVKNNDIYYKEKKIEHKKEFEYQHKYNNNRLSKSRYAMVQPKLVE